MERIQLITEIRRKRSALCVGLDTDWTKLPDAIRREEDPVFAFNRAIIDATHEFCVAYKPNLAFYESMGEQGWRSLRKTMDYLNTNHPMHFTIADAKRGDIGNTSKLYAKAFFSEMNFHSITVAPYMGCDSVKPFLEYEGKWVIVLGLTSNVGANDFQFRTNSAGIPLYQEVMQTASGWGTPQNLMFVVGATRGETIGAARKVVPDHFFLVPGVGAQGGSLADVMNHGKNSDMGLLVNSSRGIIYASTGPDFAEQARAAAEEVQKEMAIWMD